jgi:hypothetical protein
MPAPRVGEYTAQDTNMLVSVTFFRTIIQLFELDHIQISSINYLP